MLGLALETSSPKGSLCLFRYEPDNIIEILESLNWQREQSHSELVTTHIETALNAQNLKVADIHLLAVGTGPGSFTGVRVAVNVTRAFGYSHKIPIYTVNTLRILAEQGRTQNLPIAAITNAYKNMVFFATYEKQRDELVEKTLPQAFGLDSIKQNLSKTHLCLGDAHSVYGFSPDLRRKLVFEPSYDLFPRAEDLARLAAKSLSPGTKTSWENVKPLYIRASAAEENLGLRNKKSE